MWQNSKVILVIFALCFLTSSLHLHDASDSYVNYLKNQQYDIKKKLQSLKGKIDSDYKSIANENDIDKKIQQLQKTLKQQRLLLSEISLQTVNQQLNSSQWVCPALTEQKKKQILDDASNIDQDLKDINNILVPLDLSKTSQPLDKAKQNIKDAEKTNDAIKKAIDSKGQQVQPSSIHPDKKTNLNAPNWILDGKKVDQLNDQYKKAAESGALQICPINQPYYSTKHNKCIECNSKDASYFSLRTGECLQCYNYDKNEHKCKDNQGSKTNFPLVEDKLIVPQGQSFDDYKKKLDDSSKVPCPNTAAFYTGQQCIHCQKYFDLQTKKCKSCQGKNYYDSKTHICKMQQKTITNLDAAKPALIIPNDKTLNDLIKDNKALQDNYKVTTCPKEKPYYNDYECVLCGEGTYFSLIQKSCSTCESGTYFNKQTNHCEKNSFYTNLDDPNWASKKPYTDIKNQLQQKAKDPLYQKCPIQKPFSTGKQCIQCGKDQHFEYDKVSCTKCYNGQYFNKNLHNCTYTQTNYQTNPQTSPNLIYEGKPKNQWMYMYYKNIENNDGISDCPKDRPYYDGIGCIICPSEHPYFNLEYKMCQKCAQGTKYSQNHHQCLTTSGNIASQVPTLQKMAAGIFA